MTKQIRRRALVVLGTSLLLATASMPSVAGARGSKACGDFGSRGIHSIKARGVGCHRARHVVHKWADSGCPPDGSTCRILRFACRVPARDNYSHLDCRRGHKRVYAQLEY